MNELSPQDASVLALLSQRPTAIDQVAESLQGAALEIARYIAGRAVNPTPEVQAAGDSIKAWAEARNAELGPKF